MKIPFKIYFPGGNRTALVFKSLPKQQYAKISRAIMERCSEIEQVGFVSNLKTNPRLDMMGGEFCGNASRCLAYELFSNNKKNSVFSVSGYKGKILGEVKKVNVAIILKKDFFKNIRPHALGYEVNLQGISFLVTSKKNIGVSAEVFLKKFVSNRPAVGLLRLVKKGKNYCIFPIIFVPSTNTLVEESACVSGSIAAALVLNKLGQGKFFNILQPSGKHFKVNLDLKKAALNSIKFSGPLVFEGTGFVDFKISIL